MGLVLVSRCFASRHSIDDSFNALKINTEEQLKVHLDSTPDTWIVGPAGSGKTCLLIEKVVFLARDIISDAVNQKILVVCYNRPLSLKIRRTIDHALKVSHVIQEQDRSEEPVSVVDVKTFDKILKDINGSFRIEDGERGVAMALQKLQRDRSSNFKHSYDHIFVDEGQDLYHAEWPSLLKMMQKSSSAHAAVADDDFNPRYFWVFYDSNQHLHLSKKKTIYSDQLRNAKKLHQILRNTEKVYSQVNKYFESLLKTAYPVRVYHREAGLEINWVLDDSLESDETTSGTNGGQSIVKHVEYLQRNDVQNRDICVLVKDVETRDKISQNLQGVGIVCQNAEELWTEANNKVVVESIRRFKGLESKVVILYDPPYVAERKTRELLYTAISRCLCYLVVISTKQGCESLKSQDGLSGIPGAFFPNPGQLPPSETVDMNASSLENTSMAFPAKRQFQDDDDSHLNQLYKKLKEIAGGSGHCLLGQGRNPVDCSVRDREFKSLLPSLWNHLQLFPGYTNVTQPALNKIGALLEYRVLQKSNFGNYVGNMRAKVQEIDTSTQKKEMDADVAGALKVPLRSNTR